jgi:hypothetical protein
MAFLAGKRDINTVKYSSILKNSPNFFFFSSFYQLFLERVSVKFLPFSINKNDKFYREKNRQYLTNRNSDFNWTKKFGISIKNYIREKSNINNLDQSQNTGIRQENKTTKENRRMQPKKGQKEHYINKNDNRDRKVNQMSEC